MNTFSFIILSLQGAIFVFLFCLGAHGKSAQPLLTFNSARKTYELNRNLLQDIAKLPLPIRVIAMHGDARVDKLTVWNMINHVWTGANHTLVEGIFQTGDSLASFTRGVWAYITQNKEGSIILLDVEAADLVEETLNHLHMFTGMIASGLNVMVREYVQNSDLHSLYYLTRLNELIFPNSSSGNFPKLRVTVSGGVKDPSGRSVEDYTRDFIAGHSSQMGMVEERKIIAKYFPRNEIAVSEIPLVEDHRLFKDFEKLSRSDYLKAMVTLATELTKFPIKRTREGRSMHGIALAKLIERLAETLSADGWMNFANIYNTIESNLCKKSEAKFLAPVFKLGPAQIESDEKNILDAFKKDCRLESGLTSAKEKLQQIIRAKKTLEDLEIILAEYESKKMEEVEKRAKSEEEIRKMIEDKDNEIAKETKARKEAEKKVQDLLGKLNTCQSLLIAQTERGWMYALRSALSDEEIPAGSKLLYSQAREKKGEDGTNCNKIFQDEIKTLKENQKRIIDALETKYSLRELSEALIKVLSLCSSIMGLALQIRALLR